MKKFIKSEVRKAIGRLAATIVFMIKGLIVAAINLVFWLAPLLLMGYLTLKLVLASFDGGVVSHMGSVQPSYHEPAATDRQGINFPDILRSAENFLRDLRILRRN